MSGAALGEPFRAHAQQRRAEMFGMHVFLATEVMLFGTLVVALAICRGLHPEAAIAVSRELDMWLGALNTVVLLTSSLLAALAVAAAREGAVRSTRRFLAGTAALGLAFLAIKAVEYASEYRSGLVPFAANHKTLPDPAEGLFLSFYFVGTGLHAVHLAIGIALVLSLAWATGRPGLPQPGRAIAIELAGLYWHLVDVVWVFLYPLLYLAR